MGRFESILKTREKRLTQTCKMVEVKIDQSHCSAKTIKHLRTLFEEAKWFYNYIISQNDIEDADTTAKAVPVKVIDHFENRSFTYLKAHMKQGLKKRTWTSVKALHTLKKHGYKIGKLKFKSEVKSIPLPELDSDFYIDFEFRIMEIVGLKQKLKVRGLEQIAENAEIANANLVHKPDGYYFHITTFVPKEDKNIPDASIGIDFGCHSQLTLSNGVKIEYGVPVSKKIKRLDRKINKNKRYKTKSKNLYKDYLKRQRAYQKLNSKKKDIRNKIVSSLVSNYKYIIFQDENVKGWQGSGHGKKITNTGIGGIIADLKNKSHTPIIVNRFFPSTQLCPKCGAKHKLEQWERVYKCGCGFMGDRDHKSAVCIEQEGLNKIPMDHRKLKIGENLSSANLLHTLTKVGMLRVSKMSSSSQAAATVR